MATSDLGERTKRFALDVVRFYVSLPKATEFQILGKQMIRSGTSVGAHYREASRSRSDAALISKIESGLQELEETIYWLELLSELHPHGSSSCAALHDEAKQLNAIPTACVKAAKQRRL